MKHIHLIGIGGTGLSAIARVLLDKGYTVSGSDQAASPLFNSINNAGATAFIGHHPDNILGADLVIRSSAIPEDNPEIAAAHTAGIPVLKRSEFLDELTQDKEVLAVAGSHGKTTTSAMLIWILTQLGLDPSYIAGGEVKQLQSNAHAGSGPHFVIEADEYDHMFLGLSPKIAIVTNIEHDHPDLFPTREDYRQAFKAFLERLRHDGVALLCFDDLETNALAQVIKSTGINILSYGSNPDDNYRAIEITTPGGEIRFSLTYRNGNHNEQNLGEVTLSIPGHHNTLNAAAALAAIHQLGLSVSDAINALESFTGAGRRFEVLGSINDMVVIDDYGHHPTEIAATIKAARRHYPDHRIWAVWQPHTFSRTKMLETEFIQALDLADRVIVLKVYAAREKDPAYSSKRVAESIQKHKAIYQAEFDSAESYLLRHLSPKDVVIVFSAGDATILSQNVLMGLTGDKASSEQAMRGSQ